MASGMAVPMLTLVLLCLGVALSLLKGFDWPEALALATIAGLLALFRHEFYLQPPAGQ
jgi:phosphatidylglycerol lysyltransferase